MGGETLVVGTRNCVVKNYVTMVVPHDLAITDLFKWLAVQQGTPLCSTKILVLQPWLYIILCTACTVHFLGKGYIYMIIYL